MPRHHDGESLHYQLPPEPISPQRLQAPMSVPRPFTAGVEILLSTAGLEPLS